MYPREIEEFINDQADPRTIARRHRKATRALGRPGRCRRLLPRQRPRTDDRDRPATGRGGRQRRPHHALLADRSPRSHRSPRGTTGRVRWPDCRSGGATIGSSSRARFRGEEPATDGPVRVGLPRHGDCRSAAARIGMDPLHDAHPDQGPVEARVLRGDLPCRAVEYSTTPRTARWDAFRTYGALEKA